MKKTMKKLMVLIMTMMMGMSLVACGGADKQPAIDAFNKTSTSFNEVANIINENPQAYDQDLVDTMVDMAGVLNEHKQILESDDDVEEEKLQEMIDWYGTVDEWVAQVKEEISKQFIIRSRGEDCIPEGRAHWSACPFLIAKIKILLLYCKKTFKMHVYFYVLYLSLDSIFDRDIHSVRIAEPLI